MSKIPEFGTQVDISMPVTLTFLLLNSFNPTEAECSRKPLSIVICHEKVSRVVAQVSW